MINKILLSVLVLFYSNIYVYSAPGTIDNHIKIDQFGYRCFDQKIAVISNPQTGFNSGSPFTPGTGANQYQIRNWLTDAIVYTGTLVAWNGGATQSQSGDKVWWFDFSILTYEGSYYVYDVTNNVGSYRFEIRDDVYKFILTKAMRSYYYQRCGVPKSAPYAETGWTNGACHVGAEQDSDCRLFNNTSVTTSKDLSGGWHDAGDYNKYVNFAWGALTDLMLAYEENPTVWTDDYNIPESGNGVPDILDEVKFELDWILKMQNSDGSVLSVIGGGSGSPPSADGNFRRYGPATTSASYTAASVLAQGAIQFKSLGIPAMTTYANTLQTAAENAWTWANANPNITFYNQPNSLAAGEQEFSSGSYAYNIIMRKLSAASFLYKLTGTVSYKTFIESDYTQSHLYQWSWVYPFEGTEQDILLYYAAIPGVTALVATNIRNRFSNSVRNSTDNLPAFTNNTDAYRAHLKNQDYVWGSNSVKCKQANMYMSQNYYNLDSTNATNYTNAASGHLHYMHGINPLAIVYLSNMSSEGAENSVNEFYHSWFSDGSPNWDRVGVSNYGPAPGFVPGGPNPSWSLDDCCSSWCSGNSLCVNQVPPGGQPIQKSFKDWNTSWPQNSWEVSENGIYYNASYIRLLSKFMATGSCGTTLPSNTKDKVTLPNLEIKAYPNPFHHKTTIEVKSPFNEKIQLRIISPLGKELMSFKEYHTNESIEINGELLEGLLILEVKNNNGVSTLKLIKN